MSEVHESLEAYQKNLNSIISNVDQIQTKIDKGFKNINIEGSGISFLDVKYQLMLEYVTCLSFYSLLKVSGKSIQGHPVINKLNEIRTYLEKMKPIEAKLKYQIDKLVRASTIEPKIESSESAVIKDPLQFKPNPENLVPTKVETEENGENIYRAPKIAPMPFDDKPLSSRVQRDEMRQKEKAIRSRLIQDLVVDFDDRPEEQRVVGGYGEIEDEEIKDRNRYEEENFVRLQPNKKVLRKEKEYQKGLLNNDLLTLDDFRGVSSISSFETQQKEDLSVLSKIRAKRIRTIDDDQDAYSKKMDRAESKTEGLFNGVITDPSRSQVKGGLFKKSKSNFKKKSHKKRG